MKTTHFAGSLGAAAILLAACTDSTGPGPNAARLSPGTNLVVASTPIGSGAIFTSDVACTGTNVNIYANQADVYLDGGPTHPGAAGLPDGNYYVRVTEPNGTLLGTSVGAIDETPAHVVGGEFTSCVHLFTALIRASNGLTGFDITSNGGGEYKVWISNGSDFAHAKTDNFKVQGVECDENGENCAGTADVPEATLNVVKFYDANANGINDDGQLITGWKVRIQDGIDLLRFTPVSMLVEPDDYTVTEFMPVQTNWMGTTTNPVLVTLNDGDNTTVEFGNLCLGAGGGLTLGFWSNKNGGKTITENALLAGVLALNLRKANGTLLGVVTLANFQKFLLEANATNMANMLSAQLAAMHLNVASGKVNGGSLIYAPGTNSANALGFATVSAVMAEANTLLGTGGATPLLLLAGHPDRARAEALKTAIDRGNNNLNFVQATPCAFTFAPDA